MRFCVHRRSRVRNIPWVTTDNGGMTLQHTMALKLALALGPAAKTSEPWPRDLAGWFGQAWPDRERYPYWSIHPTQGALLRQMAHHLALLEKLGQVAIFRHDSWFPKELLELPAPPSVFFFQGNLPTMRPSGAVGIVGSRAALSHQLEFTRTLSKEIVNDGRTVISGGAIGIDGAAHQAALDADGQTLCVLPSGLDVPYPPRHRRLFTTVADRGGLLSPFPPNTAPQRFQFHRRNSFIAAMADTTVVVAAQRRSGALITAQWASRLGRRLVAVPGTPGCDDLLANGVHPLKDPRALFAEPETPALERQRQDSPLEQKLRELDTASIGELAAALSEQPASIALALFELQRQGHVTVTGGRYRWCTGLRGPNH